MSHSSRGMFLCLLVGGYSDTGMPSDLQPCMQAKQHDYELHSDRGCRGWLVPVLMTRTEDIYLAAGLDAVVMLKTIEYGVQIFTPMAMLSLAIRAFIMFVGVTHAMSRQPASAEIYHEDVPQVIALPSTVVLPCSDGWYTAAPSRLY